MFLCFCRLFKIYLGKKCGVFVVMKSVNFMGNFKCSNSLIDIVDCLLDNSIIFILFYEECVLRRRWVC